MNSLAQVSHKLRTPLTVIMSTVNNFLDGAFGALTEEQRKWIKKLERHTAQLEESLNDVLGIMQVEQNGRQTNEQNRTTRVTGEGRVIIRDGAPKILIVDDEPDILDTIQEGLQMKGFTTFTASNGDDAVKLALTHSPDLVLMDVLLGRQSGLEVGREIKAKLKVYTPVILMTGQDDLREKLSGAPEEADDLLTKPFQIVELMARVNSMLRLKKLNDELEGFRHGVL